MSLPEKPQVYRDLIDDLVQVCHEGQGQIGAARVRAGVWNASATPQMMGDQHAINVLLERLEPKDREVVAAMLCRSFEGGVFEALKALEKYEVVPFADGYEGSPYHDFIGRLSKEWEWPQ